MPAQGVPCGQVAGIDFYFAPFQQFLASGLAGEAVRAEAGLAACSAAGHLGCAAMSRGDVGEERAQRRRHAGAWGVVPARGA